MFKKLVRALAPVVVLVIGATVSGCDGATVTIDGKKGVPLADLDQSGPTPSEVALLGPDKVKILPGEKLAISVEGDSAIAEKLRFNLGEGKLAISRDNWKSGDNSGVATITVTMPPPKKLVMAGTGEIGADALTGDDAEIIIAGTGIITVPAVAVKKLGVTIAGTGRAVAGGTAETLSSTIAGTGDADLSALKAGSADIDLFGAGSLSFASDGEVKANIVGPGSVTVKGRARCTVKTVGPGKLVCTP